MRLAAIGLFVLCVALFLAPGGTRAATFYNPCAKVSLSSTAANTASSITQTFGVGLDPQTCGPFFQANDRPGEWIHKGVIYFTPSYWQIAKDADIPDGVEVGEVHSQVVLGLFDNGCNQVLKLNFALLDGTLDVANPVDALSPGRADRLKPLSVKNGDGVPAAAEKWPSYLTDLAEQSGMDLSKVLARAVGVNTTDIVGTTTILNMLIFEPGTTIFRGLIIDPNLGYPTISILNDPTAPSSSAGFVSDFCAPFRFEYSLYDTVAGQPYRQNPGDGVYDFVSYSVPSPDADSDGIENTLDPCPYEPNLSGWDPRGILVQGSTPGDNDVDGLPDECDPNLELRSACQADTGASGHDEDCDGWSNRVDNCALVSNDDQADADGDAIGDICDRSIVPESSGLAACTVNTLTIGSGGAAPANPLLMSPCNVDTCVCLSMGDLDCDQDVDNTDLLLELYLLADINVPCFQNRYLGCDWLLNAPDVADMLRYLALHEGVPCIPLPPPAVPSSIDPGLERGHQDRNSTAPPPS